MSTVRVSFCAAIFFGVDNIIGDETFIRRVAAHATYRYERKVRRQLTAIFVLDFLGDKGVGAIAAETNLAAGTRSCLPTICTETSVGAPKSAPMLMQTNEGPGEIRVQTALSSI